MNYSKLKNGLLFCRNIHSKNIHFKSTGSSNHAGHSRTITVPSEKHIHTVEKSKQNPLNKNFSGKKVGSGNFTKTDTELRNFIFSNKNDPDSFGSLSEEWKMHEQLKLLPDEEDDIVEREFLNNREGKTRLTTNQYGRIIKKFLNENKIALALDVLETRMLKIDKVKPENYIYNLLIGACGQVGYTKKAFKLYNQMKERGLKVTGHTYTGLFNACANSPYPQDGLKRARHLQGIMLEKAVLMNPIIYHAMIKAFGRCGDLETSFMLVDEMVEKKMGVLEDTFNFLLQACITDKTSGFRHALLVWRKMLEKRTRPSLYSFNLLLRCSRDCGLGDEVASQQVIQVLLQSGQIKSKRLSISAESEKKSETKVSLVPNTEETGGSLPNLIGQLPTMGSVTAVTSITLPEHRLMLMGGSKGILEQMSVYGVKPDIKTFTQLLDQLPSCVKDELELIEAAKQASVTLDVDFCNMLIRKRCLRKDYENATDVLKIIHAENLRPTIMTFGVLAMACQTVSSAKQLLQDINKIGYRPNIEILGTLLKNACYARNCNFVMEILKTLEEEDMKPNEMLLKHIDNFYNFITTSSNNKVSDDSRKQHFVQYYNTWRQKVQTDTPPHPWDQFREPHREPQDIELMNTGMVKYAK